MTLRGLHVVVTGGAGFIGGNLCRRLTHSEEIARVSVIDDFSSGNSQNLADLDVEVIEGSVLDDAVLTKAVSTCNTIIHLAAVPSVPRSIKDPLRSHEANATGTLRVLEAARRKGGLHVVLASSSSVYGANPAIPKTEDLQCQPMSPYAVSKLAGEQYAMAYARCYDLPVLPFRFFNVYGPLQPAGHAYAAVVPAFLEAALAKRPIPIYGDGMQSRDFTFVDTVTEVLHEAAIRRLTSAPVNLAFGTRTNLLEVVAILERIVGRDLPIQFHEPRPGDVRDSQASDKQLRSLVPAVVGVPLEKGLERTLAWFRESRALHPRR